MGLSSIHFTSIHIYFVLLPDPIWAGFLLFELIFRRNRLTDFYKNGLNGSSGDRVTSNGSKGVAFPSFFHSDLYIFLCLQIMLKNDSVYSGADFPGNYRTGWDCPSPDARSGASMPSNGNKGVHFPSFSHQYIYTLFFCQIPYRPDFRFSSLSSGGIGSQIFIKTARIAVPGLRHLLTGPGGIGILPFVHSRYIFSSFYRITRFSGPRENPAPFRAGFAPAGGYGISPDIHSGGSMCSNGNKGVLRVPVPLRRGASQ